MTKIMKKQQQMQKQKQKKMIAMEALRRMKKN